jgi:2'-5' RNA ligase
MQQGLRKQGESTETLLSGGERLRLFTAVELPPEWRESLRQQARRLDSAVPGFGRWVNPSLMHITLVFLGAQPVAQVAAIEHAMRDTAAAMNPFELRADRLGHFGSSRSVHVTWASVQDRPVGALARLRDSLAEALVRSRVAFDPAPFRPHITLARARREATPAQSEAMHRALTGRAWEPAPDPLEVAAITLVRSDLRPSGPIYTPLRRQALRRDE